MNIDKPNIGEELFDNGKHLETDVGKICELFHHHKLLINALQPRNRSFSQPELSSDLLNDFKLFRELFICKNFNQSFVNGTTEARRQSKCDISRNSSDNSDRPVPKPRKSVVRRRQKNTVSNDDTSCLNPKEPCDTIISEHLPPINGSIASATCLENDTKNPTILSLPEQSTNSNVDHSVPSMADQQTEHCSSDKLSSCFQPIDPFASSKVLLPTLHSSSYVEQSPIKIPTKIKTKNSFRSFLKINKIANNKFLSIRMNRTNGKRSLFRFGSDLGSYKPHRPNRTPPPPPILVFRPAAPLPNEDGSVECEVKIENTSSDNSRTNSLPNDDKKYKLDKSLFENDTISELYHDAMIPEDVEGLYYSLDEETLNEDDCESQENPNDPYKGLEETYDAGNLFENLENKLDNNYNYYDDSECIYEELSSNDETIYEEYIEEENIYDNAEAGEIAIHDNDNKDKKQLKRLKKARKMMERFNMNGDEIPVNAGVVKEDKKGSKHDLFVRRGETVLILRMEDNPPGKWLAKNERSKIGYVDLDNLYFDAESIKAVIKSFEKI